MYVYVYIYIYMDIDSVSHCIRGRPMDVRVGVISIHTKTDCDIR